MYMYIYVYTHTHTHIHYISTYIQVVKDIDKALMSHLLKLSGRESPFGKTEFRGRVDMWIPFLPYEFKHKCAVVVKTASYTFICIYMYAYIYIYIHIYTCVQVVKTLEDRVLSYYLNEAPETQRFVVGWDQAAVELLASSKKSAYCRSLLPL